MPQDISASGLRLCAGVWAGLILGVSFLATIAKFDAPSLSLPVALDVGRHTFQQLMRVEWVLAAIALALMLRARPSKRAMAAWAFTLVLFIMEALWLLPALDRRVLVTIAGASPVPSVHHILFVAIEAIRAVTLLWLGWQDRV